MKSESWITYRTITVTRFLIFLGACHAGSLSLQSCLFSVTKRLLSHCVQRWFQVLTAFNNLITFLSTFSSKRGLDPVGQSSFYPPPPHFVMHLKSSICAGCDSADINLAASSHTSAVGNRQDGCKLTFPGVCFSRPSGRVTRPERSLFLHSAIRWPYLQSPLSVLLGVMSCFFFAQDGVLVRQNALCMCCVSGTDKTVALRTGLVGSLRFGSSASKHPLCTLPFFPPKWPHRCSGDWWKGAD